MFTIVVFVVVFAILFGACVVGVILLDEWLKLIPIGLGLVVLIAAILLFPRIFPALTVDYTPVACEPVACKSVACEPVACEPVVVIPDEPVAETTPVPVIYEPAYDVVINGCPTGSLGTHPNTGEPLIFKANPYPGVVCEFELYYNAQIAKVTFPTSQGVIVEDWLVTCPSGAPCEGVWYQTATTYVPAAVLTHYWVFVNGYAAEARFPSHACEYAAKTDKGHTNANIRVPVWAENFGSIFDHPGCPLPTP